MDLKKLSRKERDKFYNRPPNHTFRMDKREWEQVKAKAATCNRSVADIIRQLLKEWLDG